MRHRIPFFVKAFSYCDRRGGVLVLTAVLLTVLLGFVSFTVDVGYIVLWRTKCQVAADGAALAAAQDLQKGSSSPTTSRNTAIEVSGLNFPEGIPNGTWAQDVVFGTWDIKLATFTPLSGAAESQANAVQVTCSRSADRSNALALFFAPVLGCQQTNTSASAIARIKPSRCGLINGLTSITMSGSSYTDSYQSANGSYGNQTPGNNGHVCSNGDITMSGSAAIHGDAHFGIGKRLVSSGSSRVTGTKNALTNALSYPAASPGDASWNNWNSHIPLSDRGKTPLNSNKEFTLSGNDGVTLPPGTYYFSKLSLSGSSSIRINGPTTIYVTGDVALSGGTFANSTFLPKNLQLFPMGSKCDLSGNSELYAAVYGPTTEIIRSGTADFYGAIVGSKVTMSGGGGIHADESLDIPTLNAASSRTVLVQ